MIDDFSSGEFLGADSFNLLFQQYVAQRGGAMLGGNRAVAAAASDGFRVVDGALHYSSEIQYGPLGQYNQYWDDNSTLTLALRGFQRPLLAAGRMMRISAASRNKCDP